jgi:hypothetical protein
LPTPKPAARELSGESFFGIHPLRLFNRQVSGHLIDPSRHPVGQRPFDGKIRSMLRLARGKFGRMLFGALLGGRKLRLERIDVGFKRSDDLIGKRPFIRIPEALTVSVNPSAVVPTLRRPNSCSLIVSERFLPSPTLGALPNRLGRDAQQVRRLPVGEPLARQIAPVGKTSDDPAPPSPSAARVLPHLGRGAQDEATG